MPMPRDEWVRWRRRRRAYYAALAGYFAAAAFYFGPNLIMFGKLTRLAPADFIPVVQERCVPVVRAMKQYQRDHGRLPTRERDLVPDYLPEVEWSVLLARVDGFEYWGEFNHVITYDFTPDHEGWRVRGEFVHGPIPLPLVDLPATPKPAIATPTAAPGREP
jgi:hypothetical protein